MAGAWDDATTTWDDAVAVWDAVPDVTAPTVPANLHTTAVGSTTTDLAWDASTDATGVAGYEVVVSGP